MATAPHKALTTKQLPANVPIGYGFQRNIAKNSVGVEYAVVRDTNNTYPNLRLWKKVPVIGLWEPVAWITTDTAANRENSSPSLAIDSLGYLHCVWHALDATYTTTNRLRYSVSTDGGATWAAPTLISDTGNYAGVNGCLAIGSDNHLHVVYYGIDASTGGKYNIHYRLFTTSWQAIELISVDTTNAQYMASMCVDGSDAPHVCWVKATGTGTPYTPLIYATKAATWTIETASSDVSLARPSIVHTGTYPVIAYQNTAASESQQIRWVSRAGGTWSAPASVNADTAYAQSDPSLGIDSRGRLVCAWAAKTAAFSTYFEIWVSTYSSAWATPVRISEGTKTTKDKSLPQVRWSYWHANGLDEVTTLFCEANRAATGDALYDFVWEYTHVAKVSRRYLPLVSEEAIESYAGCARTFTAPTKNTGNPLVGFGAVGDPDEKRAYQPAVVQVADGDWRMWYSGLDANTYMSICYATATSVDGPWTKQGRVIAPGALRTTPEAVGTWDYQMIGANTVLYDPSAAVGYKFKMVCWGAKDTASTSSGSLYKGGYARSEDGVTWYLYVSPGTWVEGIAGGSDTVPVFGPSGTADDFYYYNAQPWSMFDLGDDAPDAAHRYLVAFQGWGDNGPTYGRMGGVAYSSDWVTWTKYPVPILEGTLFGWPASAGKEQFHGINVFAYRGAWTVIGEPITGAGPAEVNLMRSERLGVGLAEQGTDKSIPVGAAGTWDDTHTYNYATVPIRAGGETALYYSGNADATTNPILIGLASIVTDREVGYGFSANGSIRLKPILNPTGLVLRLNLDGLSAEKIEVALENLSGTEITGYGQAACDDITVGGTAVLVTWGGSSTLPAEDCIPVIYRTAV